MPWAAARSVAQWHGERAARGAASGGGGPPREAAKQSRRARVPMVADLAATAAVADRLRRATAAFVLHEVGRPRRSSARRLPAARRRSSLVVGPEGGISDDELAAFTAAGATAVRLGEPVLRTSTAGAAALAVLSVRLGRSEPRRRCR